MIIICRKEYAVLSVKFSDCILQISVETKGYTSCSQFCYTIEFITLISYLFMVLLMLLCFQIVFVNSISLL